MIAQSATTSHCRIVGAIFECLKVLVGKFVCKHFELQKPKRPLQSLESDGLLKGWPALKNDRNRNLFFHNQMRKSCA